MAVTVSEDPPSASAFAPGHVTGFFSPCQHEDPHRAGSIGAGVTLTHGVTATVTRAHESAQRSPDLDAPIDAVELVASAFDPTFQVRIETRLPIGAGFGVSGAAALATAIASNDVSRQLDGPVRSENELIGLAHAADVRAGTGLGDVVAQARGGVPIRLEAGAPPHGTLDGISTAGRVEYLSLGKISTAEVLAGETEAIASAGNHAIDRLRRTPRLGTFMACSRRFAAAADLLTEDVRDVLSAVDETTQASSDPTAIMVMLGRSVFALGDTLSAAGYEPETCHIHGGGARLDTSDLSTAALTRSGSYGDP